MKHKAFYVDAPVMEEYLSKYGRGARSKDYEYAVALHAKTFWEKKDGVKYRISFEQNDKMHSYPNDFTPTAEELRDILLTYNKEYTDVDFGLAPVSASGKLEGYTYPFQIKKYVPDNEKPDNEAFAAYISEKANHYRAGDTCMIVFPEMLGREVTEGYDIAEVKKHLNIDEGAVRAIYGFQFDNGTPNFILLWASQKALSENV